MFLVVLHRSGPDYDPSRPLEEQSGWPEHAAFMDGLVDDGFIVLGGPLADEHRVVHAVEAESADAVRATLARDPWSGSHLRGRRNRARGRSGSTDEASSAPGGRNNVGCADAHPHHRHRRPVPRLLRPGVIDIFRNRADLTVSAKAVWAIFLLILPFIGLLVYTMVRPADSQIARRR